MKKAFTLVEILLVVSILLVLMWTTLPRFKGMQNAGRISQVRGELQTLQTAIQSYYINHAPNVFPVSTTALTSTVLVNEYPQIILTPTYDPFGITTTTEYNYILTNDNKYFVVYSVGPTAGSVGSVSIVNGGTVTISEGAICATNGTGC